MKGGESLIAAVLLIAITLAAIVIAFQLSNPGIDRTKENLIFQEGKSNLVLIDSSVKEVVLEGNGSSRLVSFHTTEGSYQIFPQNDSIYFSMESKAQIFGVGVSKIEDEINVTGYPNKVVMFVNYTNIDIQGGAILGKGNRDLMIKSFGWDPITQKHVVNIT